MATRMCVFHMLLFTGEQPIVLFCVIFTCNMGLLSARHKVYTGRPTIQRAMFSLTFGCIGNFLHIRMHNIMSPKNKVDNAFTLPANIIDVT